MLETASTVAPLVVDASFIGNYWEVGAFGDPVFDAAGNLLAEQDGLVQWLGWLQAAQGRGRLFADTDQNDLQQQFSRGEAAYLVASTTALPNLSLVLDDEVRVVTLPSGPGGDAEPLLTVSGFLYPAVNDEAQVQLGLSLAKFLGSAANQKLLAEQAFLLPTNRLRAENTDVPAVNTFSRQAAMAFLSPPSLQPMLAELGDRLYSQALDGGVNPEEAVAEFLAAVQETTK